MFIILPAILIYVTYLISKKLKVGVYTKYVIPVLGSFFFFIEIFNPSHINGNKNGPLGIEGEREFWIESMKAANERITSTLNIIKKKIPMR